MTTQPQQPTQHHAALRTPSIEIVGVEKSFSASSGTVRAVRGIDLTVQPGEVVAFLGPNGAGKTTTIDMLLGLSTPDAGTIEVFGTSPREAVSRGMVTSVMQTGGLLGDITVGETVELMASFYTAHRPVAECMDRAGVSAFADRRVDKCSGGQKQRLRFALALIPDPELIVLDEPTTGMDVAARREFWDAMRSDSDAGRTVLFATHYLEEADAYADRIVLISSGRIVADGSAAQIKALASGRRVSAQFGPESSGAATAREIDARVRGIHGVSSVEWQGDRLLVGASDSDAVARYLLTETAARDLEISSHSLEDAFLALTSAE